MHTLISKSKVVSLGLNKNKGAFKSPQMYGIFKEKTKKKKKSPFLVLMLMLKASGIV